jgi:hypothetical protein
MSITKQDVYTAESLLHDLQTTVFFNKLASLGIEPRTEQEAELLWGAGDDVLRQYPRVSQEGVQVKQAGMNLFPEKAAKLTNSGFSNEAHEAAETLLQQAPQYYKAASILLAVNNS